MHSRTDPTRNETRTKVLVRFNAHGAKFCMVGGQLIMRRDDGEPTEVTLYDGDVAALRVYVEKEHDKLALAKEIYMRELRDRASETTRDPIDKLASDDIETWPENSRRFCKMDSDSVEARFQTLAKRGIHPLEEVVEIEKLDAPATEEETSILRLAKALNVSGQGANTDLIRALAKSNEDMAKRLADLEAKLASSKKS